MNARLLRHQTKRQLSHKKALLWYLHAISICSLCRWECYQSNFFRLVCSHYSANQCPWESSLISSSPRILGKCYLIHCWEFHKRFSFTHPDYEQSTFNNESWLKFNLTIPGLNILYHFRFQGSSKYSRLFLHLTPSQYYLYLRKKKKHSLFDCCQYTEDMMQCDSVISSSCTQNTTKMMFSLQNIYIFTTNRYSWAQDIYGTLLLSWSPSENTRSHPENTWDSLLLILVSALLLSPQLNKYTCLLIHTYY